MDLEDIRSDFDALARMPSQHGSGSDRYDRYLLSRVPSKAETILDVGCGLGRLTRALAGHERRVVGLDLSPAMLERAALTCAGLPGVTFVCGDFLTFEFDERFDCIISAAAVHHMPLGVTLDRMRDLVAPGGRVIIHDLRAGSGLADDCLAWAALTQESLKRWLRTGSPLSPPEVRKAWARHSGKERYLSLDEIAQAAERLQEAQIVRHWMWRYTMIWDQC